MVRPLRVLVVEDSEPDTQLMLHDLADADFKPTHARVETAEAFRRALGTGAWDVVLSEYTMPRFSGLEALRLMREFSDGIPFIFVTGSINEETAVECLKRGADDYVLKNNLKRLGRAVSQALQRFEDRRQRLRLEEHLRQSQKLEAIGTLASGMAHDFHNLLAVIFGNVEELADHLPDDGAARQSLQMIHDAAQQARGVTNSLLTFTHRAVAEKSPVDLLAVVDQSMRFLRHVLPATAEVVVDAPAEPPIWVHADQTQLQQVLMNLAVNARDAMPEGGRIRIRVRCQAAPPVDVRDTRSRGSRGQSPPAARGVGVLVVEDDGTGMPEEVRARIFEPFFTTKPRGEGTGLGLSVIHGIVTEHGGRIRVDSRPGRGTRVTVWLPCCAPPKPAARRALRRRRPGRGEVVIVVEDNEYIRSIMGSTLRAAGYDVVQAADGLEAMRAFAARRDQVRLLVMDVDLPKKSGLACLRDVRGQDRLLPVIIVTGSADGDLHARLTPRESLLRKPFPMAELADTAARLLHKTQVQRAGRC